MWPCSTVVSQHRVPHTVLWVHRGQQLLGRDPPAPPAVGLGGAERDRPFPGNRCRRYPRSLQGFGEHSFQKRLPHPFINQWHERGGEISRTNLSISLTKDPLFRRGGKKSKTGDLKTIEHPEGCERLQNEVFYYAFILGRSSNKEGPKIPDICSLPSYLHDACQRGTLQFLFLCCSFSLV